MTTSANFNYAANGEITENLMLDFSPVGPCKMALEATNGNNFITGEEYSDTQRETMLATLAAGSILNKVISKAYIVSIANKEIEEVEGKSGTVLSMNGAGELDNLFKKITHDIVDGVGEANSKVLQAMANENYKKYPGIDCSEIAEDLYDATGQFALEYNNGICMHNNNFVVSLQFTV